jgi:long-chain acyl-CoA synthetase
MPYAGPLLEAPLQLSDLLKIGLKNGSNDPAVTSMESVMSWSDVDRASSRLAANYLALGLERGDRVASLMPNRTALIAHYVACLKAGLVLTPLNYRYTPPEINHALDVSSAKIVLAHVERASDIAASEARSLALGIIWYGGDDSQKPSLEELMKAEPEDSMLPALDSKLPAAIFFTSGSTGPAKGVTHTRETFGWMFASAVQAFEITPNDVVLPGSSCSHIGGFTFSMAALSAGARLVVARGFDHEEIGPLLRTTQPTLLSMLPTALLHLIREHDMTSADFSSLRLARSAGDKVSAELEKEFITLTGKTVSEGYGMTEFGLAALNPPGRIDKLGSIGLPSPGFVFSIRNDQRNELPKDKEGRLWVKTPTQSIGYWNDEKASAEVMCDVWFDTGDVLKIDKDGYMWFCGRQKQIIVHDGSNISPQEVEDALLEHPAVELAGVVGVIDESHGEHVRAYVEIKAKIKNPKAGELIQFAKQRVGYKAPEEIIFIDKMPLNPTGKVDRVALKKIAAGEHGHYM